MAQISFILNLCCGAAYPGNIRARFNTGHPHSHVVIRGKDDSGKDLIIAQGYVTDGIRRPGARDT